LINGIDLRASHEPFSFAEQGGFNPDGQNQIAKIALLSE